MRQTIAIDRNDTHSIAMDNVRRQTFRTLCRGWESPLRDTVDSYYRRKYQSICALVDQHPLKLTVSIDRNLPQYIVHDNVSR